MELIFYLFILVEAILISMFLTPVAMKAARTLGFVDQPNSRKVHANPTPLLGGAAIYLTFLIVILGNIFLVWILRNWGNPQGHFFQQLVAEAATHLPGVFIRKWELLGLILGATVVFVLGLYDDRYTLRPLVKLGGQIGAALIFSLFYYHAGNHDLLFITNAGVIFVLLIIWIVGVTNSLNLMDNMDGLCAGVSIIALFFLSLVTYQLGKQTFMILSMLTLMGALLGFLYHNFNPARIFMGDAGSMFVGFTIACLVVFSTFYTADSQTALTLAMPPVILAVPMFDTASVIAIRIKRGLPIYQADKNHFSHRLVALGLSHKNAVLLIYLISICTGIGALLLSRVQLPGAIIILAQVIIILTIILVLERAGQPNSKQNH